MSVQARRAAVTEFRSFVTPQGFAGGCKKSLSPGICAHLTWEGKVGKLQQGCPYYDICKGENLKFNP